MIVCAFVRKFVSAFIFKALNTDPYFVFLFQSLEIFPPNLFNDWYTPHSNSQSLCIPKHAASIKE